MKHDRYLLILRKETHVTKTPSVKRYKWNKRHLRRSYTNTIMYFE